MRSIVPKVRAKRLATLLAVGLQACRTPDASTVAAESDAPRASEGGAREDVWQDVTADPKGARAFLDRQRGLVWSPLQSHAGKPLLLTWRAAGAHCQQLGGWRLPTRAEYDGAIRDEGGGLRKPSLIDLGEQAPAFDRVLPFQSLWTATLEFEGGRHYWAAQRYESHLIYVVSRDDARLPFRCVQDAQRFLAEPPKTTPKPPPSPPPPVAKKAEPTVATFSFTLEQLAKTPAPPEPSETRERVTAYLRRAFAQAGHASNLLDPNGDLVIAAASGFSFGGRPSLILQEQIPELREVLAEYAKVLSAAGTLEGMKFRIEVIGHASPTHQGEPQVGYDPDDAGGRANREAGMRRALQVARILSAIDAAKGFPIESYSMGSLEGIRDPMGPNKACGEFSCVASRRVVVRFHVDDPR